MNANFGIILRCSIVESLLSPAAPVVRYWGDEEVEIGEKKFIFPPMENCEFQLYPLTTFVRDHLPVQLSGEEHQYVAIVGQALDDYDAWVRDNDVTTKDTHAFEKGLLVLIQQAGAATILFAPEGERLDEFVSVDLRAVIDLLRRNVRDR